MRRVVLITNPYAARNKPNVVRTVTSELEREACQVEVVPTSGPGDATRIARAAVDDGVDIVTVYGGDGTIMQAVKGMIGQRVPLGIIPGGTGNLLAGNLKLSRSPKKAARTVARGVKRTIDVGRAETSEGARFFAVACGAGYDAEIMAATSGQAKRRWGMGAYMARVVTTVRALSPTPFAITVDDEPIQLDAVMVLVANCQHIMPPFLSLGPSVTLDDGVLDVVALSADGLLQAAWVVWQLAWHHPDGPHIVRRRGHTVRIECEPAQPVQLDGEPGGTTPFTASIVPRGLDVIVPKSHGTAS